MHKKLRSISFFGGGILAGVLLCVGWVQYTTHAQGSNDTCQAFSQTGYQVCGKFLSYWQGHGGLAQQGYPISQVFTETSALNGKPYTVQYFERAVFEMHPENQPPNDVLLSQLGTYAAKENYTKGFPATANQSPFYENRTSPVQSLLSYYNAVNRKEYDRAYSYFQGAPNPPASVAPSFQQFQAGYAGTASVTVAVGKVSTDAGAGNLYASFPVVITALQTDGSTKVFSGCYTMHRVNDGISPNPNDVLWSINAATLQAAPAGSSVDQLLAQNCAR